MRLGKVYHNIDESDYEYNFKNFKFIFSSKFYIEKFKSEIYNYIKENTEKINRKYSPIDLDEYLALDLYRKIEKRGFRVYYKNLKLDEIMFKANII